MQGPGEALYARRLALQEARGAPVELATPWAELSADEQRRHEDVAATLETDSQARYDRERRLGAAAAGPGRAPPPAWGDLPEEKRQALRDQVAHEKL